VQAQLARAEALLGSARAYLYGALADAWADAVAGGATYTSSRSTASSAPAGTSPGRLLLGLDPEWSFFAF
jgi:hypothetical protein